MSHYKPYPAYKDSGVEWLGKVPEHWEISQLKYLATHIGSGKTPSGGAEVYQDSGVLFLRSQNVYEDGLRLDDAVFITESVDQEMAGSRVQEYDVLLNITGASIGRSCLVPEGFRQANVNQHVCIVRAAETSLAKWLSQCLPSLPVQAQIDFFQNGAGREGLNFEQIGNMYVALPLVDDVGEISDALDRETTRIDALITKKSRFIELLREKRQALITHAVTKGLDPNAKMKDSGVEWLGEVPEHWSIQPLKQLARLDGGAGFPDDEQGNKDAPIPFFKVADLANGLTTAENYITPEAAEMLRAKIFPVGTIAFAKVGAALLLNRRVLMPLPGCADNNMMVALPQSVSGEWLLSVLRCFDMAWLVNPGAVPSVNQEQVGNIKIPVPSDEDQASIVACVRSNVTRIDALIGKTERSLELLKERRAALITAATTGQIDLREGSQ